MTRAETAEVVVTPCPLISNRLVISALMFNVQQDLVQIPILPNVKQGSDPRSTN